MTQQLITPGKRTLAGSCLLWAVASIWLTMGTPVRAERPEQALTGIALAGIALTGTIIQPAPFARVAHIRSGTAHPFEAAYLPGDWVGETIRVMHIERTRVLLEVAGAPVWLSLQGSNSPANRAANQHAHDLEALSGAAYYNADGVLMEGLVDRLLSLSAGEADATATEWLEGHRASQQVAGERSGENQARAVRSPVIAGTPGAAPQRGRGRGRRVSR